jgi:transcriptional regulator with XRE-family HTH domain
MKYGDRLRQKRVAKGLSQERLAELIAGRGHQTTGANISMIERGYDKRKDGEPTKPNKRFVELAAEILNDDVDEALMDADYAPRDQTRYRAQPGFYKGYYELPEDRRQLAERQIKAIIDSLAEEEDPDTDYIQDDAD